MTRTDVMASSRPRTAGAASMRRGSSRTRRSILVLPVLLLMAFALATPGAAVAAGTTTSEYNQTPNTPKEGTAPSKETTPPATSKEPSKEPATSAAPEKASTLPFTGLDLRWTLVAGLLLMGAGFSIVIVQRRRTDGSR
jgi:hypothetical protein